MKWLSLAWSGLWRRPLRTGVTAAGVGLAVAGCFCLLAFQAGYRRSLAIEIERLGAHVLVVPKGCPYDAASLALHGANWPCHLRAAYLSDVRATPGVATAAPVFMGARYEQAGRYTVYLGVDTNFLQLKPGWKFIGNFPQTSGEVLAGAEVARHRGWQLGQQVALPGFESDQGRISGLLETTQGPDDRFIYLTLTHAQALFKHPDELTHILVRLTDPSRMESVVEALRGCDAGMQMNIVPLAHLFRTIQSLVDATRWFLGCVALVGLIAAAAGVSASLLIAVAERTREIGVMRGLGASRLDIFRLFWLETQQTCVVGAGLGMVSAWLGMGALEHWLRTRLPFVPDARLLEWQWNIAGGCLALALVVGTVAGLLPAWRAAGLPPVSAMRSRGGCV